MGIIDVNTLPKEDEVEHAKIKFSNVDSTVKELSDRLSSIGELPTDEIRHLIFRSYPLFLADMYLRNEVYRGDIIKVFSNKRFLNEFIYCMGQVQLDDYQIICCNKVTWDAWNVNTVDEETKDLLLQLSSVVNRGLIQRLSGYVGVSCARMIALARNSSFKDRTVVKRVNSIILNMRVSDLQLIIDLYSVLFNTMLSSLFEGIMFDIRENLDEYQVRTNNLISAAVMTILDNVPSDIIRTVLINYAGCIALENNNNYRFHLKGELLRNTYSRVFIVKDNIEENDEIVIP